MLNQAYVLSYIIGVIFAYQLPRLISWTEVIWLIIFLCFVIASRRRSNPGKKSTVFHWIASPTARNDGDFQICCIAFTFGIAAVFLAASYHQNKHLAPELWQLPMIIQIKVKDVHTPKPYLQEYEVFSENLNQSFKLSHYHLEKQLTVGSCYELTAKFKPKRALGNPTTIYHAKAQWVNREFIRGYIVSHQPIQALACPKSWINIDFLRHEMKTQIEGSSLSKTAQAMIIALVLGERKNLTDEHRQVLAQTGTAHLLAISGLHIGLVYGVVWVLFAISMRPFVLIFLRTNLQIFASIIALGASGVYVWVSGAGVSSLRAWGMLCVVTVLLMLRQHLSLLSVLLFVVGIILLIDPLAGMGMGLWLSAGAVFALIWLNAGRWAVHWKLPMMMLPVTSIWLQSAWIGPIANMIAIPTVSFLVVPGALLGILGLQFNIPGSNFLLLSTGWVIDKLWVVLIWLNQHAIMHHWSLLTVIDKILVTSLMTCLLIPWRLIGFFPLMILFSALTWPKQKPIEPGILMLDVIDAGQGTALLIQVEDKHLLFDAGSLMVKDYLKHYRIHSLDVAVISHNDTDHRVGFEEIVQHIPIQKVYSGEILSELPDDAQQRCLAGQTWTWGEATFEFISPLVREQKGNNASCVLKITLGETSLLLTGDIEAKTERALLTTYSPEFLKTTVLIAPHHGSKTSSTIPFLQAVLPEMVIYPTGFLNSYHHPHPDIVKRYTQINAKQYNTAQDGSLRVKLSRFGIESIRCYNKDHRRWWHNSEEATCSGYLVQAGS